MSKATAGTPAIDLFDEFLDVLAALERDAILRSTGSTDLATSARERRGEWTTDTTHTREYFLLVTETGSPLGAAAVGAPLLENLDAIDAEVFPGPGPRGEPGLREKSGPRAEPVFDLLFSLVVACMTELGRTKAFMFTEHLCVPTEGFTDPARGSVTAGAEVRGASAIFVPAEGRPVVALGPDRGSLFADDPALVRMQRHGFRLTQIERCSVLRPGAGLPDAEVPAGLVPITWVGDAPAEHLQRIADINTVFERDVPKGDASFEPAVFTVERVLEHQEVRRAKGVTAYGTALLDPAAGEPGSGGILVGLTAFGVSEGDEHGFQGATVTRPEYRGRGLAKALKLLNARNLAAHAPHVTRVYTWNAAENSPMLAINNAVGFVPVLVEGQWEKNTGERNNGTHPS
ncbi:hypothetical protein [Brevibacterium samyangense]|uniref:GNAT family N-acetyltransferase n=1 Tax=Brevibacterium samyangense TaxID=366888 RepID=UPI0031E13934